jgi:murein DD-endopeptidase MepM/ murein hydrolase activator NlpD
MSRLKLVLSVLLGIAMLGTVIAVLFQQNGSGTSSDRPVGSGVAPPAAKPAVTQITENLAIQRGDTLDAILARGGVDPDAKAQMIAAVKRMFDVRKLRAGTQITLIRSMTGTVESLEYLIDPDHTLRLLRSGEAFQADVVEVPGVVRVVTVCGTMRDSLFESLALTGEAPELALEVAQIFAWDLDFYTDPNEGDEFCLVVEKKEYENGQPPVYRRILAARYNNAGAVYEAFLYPDRNGNSRYYSRDGRSLQAAFLRSPMKFEARISSRFSRRRFHPVLRIYRPHLGTDYAAPGGTTVQAIAAGRVIFSGRSGGAGNLIKIRHAGGFESQYMHLSRRFVRAGQHVDQGQRIGTVGATGLATGPHLDFRLRQNGRYVNFERLRPPRMTRINAERMQSFTADRDRHVALMEAGTQSAATEMASGMPASTSPIVD